MDIKAMGEKRDMVHFQRTGIIIVKKESVLYQKESLSALFYSLFLFILKGYL